MGRADWRLLLVAALVNAGSYLHLGYHLMILNSTQGVIRDFMRAAGGVAEASVWPWSAVIGSFVMGLFLGNALLPAVANRFRRKTGLWMGTLLLVLGILPGWLASPLGCWPLLILCRLLVGVSVGLTSGLGTLYLGELSPRRSRGCLLASCGTAVEMGTLVAAVLTLPQILGSASLWPLLFVAELVPAILLLLALPLLPESPVCVLRQGRSGALLTSGLASSLTRVYASEEELHSRLREVQDELAEEEAASEPARFSDLLRKREVRRGFLVAVLLNAAVGFSGIDFENYFSGLALERLGAGRAAAAEWNLLIPLAGTLASLASQGLVDRVGRRPLALGGLSALLLINAALAAVWALGGQGALDGASPSPSWEGPVVAVLSVLFMVSFSLGPAPIKWFVASELVPAAHRAHCQAAATQTLLLLSALSASLFLPLLQAFGAWAFGLYLVPTAAATLLLHRHLPETKDKSFAQIWPQSRPEYEMLED